MLFSSTLLGDDTKPNAHGNGFNATDSSFHIDSPNPLPSKESRSDEKSNICEVLRLLRISRDLSGKELAERVGVSSSYISDVEAGRKRPSLDMISRYSEALGVKPSTIPYFSEEYGSKNYNHEEKLLKILEALVNRR